MSTTSKIAIGVSLVSGALLATWLLTGPRKEKTRKLITKGTSRIADTLKTEKPKVYDDSEAYYV